MESETYLQLSRTSMMELLCKNSNREGGRGSNVKKGTFKLDLITSSTLPQSWLGVKKNILQF